MKQCLGNMNHFIKCGYIFSFTKCINDLHLFSCDFNKYTLKVLSRLSLVQKSSEEQPKSIEDDDEDMLLISSKNQFEVENSDLEDTDDDDQDSD